MRSLVVACALLASLPAEAATVLRGKARGWSDAGHSAACLAAKNQAHQPICGVQGAYERAVGECHCSTDAAGTQCEVEYAAACRTATQGKSAIAVSGTWQGFSPTTQAQACFVAQLAAQGVVCPRVTLDRKLGACDCEERDGRFECLVDQVLWCQL